MRAIAMTISANGQTAGSAHGQRAGHVEGDLTIEHYRELLTELRSGLAERARSQEELNSLESTADEGSFGKLESLQRALDRQYQSSLAQLEERNARERQLIDDRLQAKTDSAAAIFGQETGEIERTAAAELERAERKFQEDSWLLSSILDDKSENSPKWQIERLKTQLEQTRERLAAEADQVTALYDEAVAQVEQRRQRVEPEPAPAGAPADRERALEAATVAAQTVRAQFDLLSQQFVPRLLEGWNSVVPGLLLWGALAAAGDLLLAPQALGLGRLTAAEWLIANAGVALAVVGGMLLVVYSVAVTQTTRVFEPLQQAVVDFRMQYEHWQRFAADDLQRCEHGNRARYASIVERRDKSLQQFVSTRDQRIHEASTIRERELRAAAQQRDADLLAAREQHNREMLSCESEYSREMTSLRTRCEREQGLLAKNHRLLLAEQDARRIELARHSESAWQQTLEWFANQAAALQAASRELSLAWEAIAAPEWQPPDAVPRGVRIGDFSVKLQDAAQTDSHDLIEADERPAFGTDALSSDGLAAADASCLLPAVLPFPARPSLLIKAGGAGRAQAIPILQTAMLRLLAQLPPGDVRLTIFDPVGLGENFAAFMHLADYDDLLISSRIWTEQSHIEQQLANLTEHMENVFQKYLRNEFESIEEYNAQAGEVAEPYRILIVANFPSGFSERAAARLESVMTSGGRCGVYTLISVDTGQPAPRGVDLSRLEAAANVLEWRGGCFVTCGCGPQALPFIGDAPPRAQVLTEIIRKIGELSRHIRRVEVPFYRIAPREDAYWKSDSRAVLDVPLGRAGATKLQHLRLGPGTSQHVLVAGKTGSGKSTLLHVIVMNLVLRYSPDEIEFYLIDFKKGVEFKTYAAHRLPHARVISIESDREFGVSTLERLDAILKERGDLFRLHGVQDIASFRNACADVRMPRIVLLVDEFQEFFVEDDRHSQTAALLLDRLVRQGRAFGIHVLLGSQTLGGAYSLARTTIGQMAVRIALQCSETDAHLILSEDNTAARLLTRPGEAIYNDANGMLEGNNPFQIAWLADDERDGFLVSIQKLTESRERTHEVGSRWPEPIVFEGNVPADPARNADLTALIESAVAVPAGDSGAAKLQDVSSPRIWLGDAVAITGPVTVTFSRRSGANLLIAGGDPLAAMGILSTSLVALAAQVRTLKNDTRSVIPRFCLFSVEPAPSAGGRWSRFADTLTDQFMFAGPGNAADVVGLIAAEVAQRRQQPEYSPPVFVFIDELSRFRDLRKSDDDFGFGSSGRDKGPTGGQAFADILREGPTVGVFVVVWCESYNNIDRWLSRQSLREFDMRVVFQMSVADSSNLIDSPAASRLGTNRALLYSDERGTIEKFRPYAPASEDWFVWAARHLAPTAPTSPAADEVVAADDIDQWRIT
jgi:hypothetical protein